MCIRRIEEKELDQFHRLSVLGGWTHSPAYLRDVLQAFPGSAWGAYTEEVTLVSTCFTVTYVGIYYW